MLYAVPDLCSDISVKSSVYIQLLKNKNSNSLPLHWIDMERNEQHTSLTLQIRRLRLLFINHNTI